MIISSSMAKIITEKDCVEIQRGVCLCNQGFQFQLYLEKKQRKEENIQINGSLAKYITVYRVYDRKGTYEHPLNKKTDDYYIKSEDDMYPDLLKKVDRQDYRFIRFTFESEYDEIVPCYLLIPKLGKEKYPVAITLQGHTTGFHV